MLKHKADRRHNYTCKTDRKIPFVMFFIFSIAILNETNKKKQATDEWAMKIKQGK